MKVDLDDKRRTGSLVERVCRELERRIVTGELRPGTRLEESVIAREMNVSRTPVREALRQLLSTRLVERTLNYSAVVAKPSRDELAGLFEAAAEIEALCAGLAARRMRDLDKRELLEVSHCCEKAASCGREDEFGQFNERFHKCIWRGAANPSLEEVIEGIRIRLAAYRRAQFVDRARMTASSVEHSRIVVAIIGGDGAAASNAMREHIINASASVFGLVFAGTDREAWS